MGTGVGRQPADHHHGNSDARWMSRDQEAEPQVGDAVLGGARPQLPSRHWMGEVSVVMCCSCPDADASPTASTLGGRLRAAWDKRAGIRRRCGPGHMAMPGEAR